MRRLVLVLVGLSGLACGGIVEGLEIPGMEQPSSAPTEAPEPEPAPAAEAGGGGGGGNVAACRKYIEALNGLPCMSAMPKQDPAAMCQDMLDQVPCDLAKYYTCMTENSKCNGAIPDLAGTTTCGSPTCGD